MQNADAWKVYRRMIRLAAGALKLNPWDADDAASHAISVAISTGCWDAPYLFRAMKNYFLEQKRKTKNIDYVDMLDEESLPKPDRVTLPQQHASLELRGCLDAIDGMPAQMRNVMRLVSHGFESHEIATRCGLTLGRTQQIIGEARLILRNKHLYELERKKKGHHKFIGIARNRRKWRADIQDGERHIFIGIFDTASQAALAYDEEARRLGRAKFNFGASKCSSGVQRSSPDDVSRRGDPSRVEETRGANAAGAQ